MTSGVPYAGATSGAKARDEIISVLRRFKCEDIGFMDNYERGELLLTFRHRGRTVQLRASASGWAALYLKQHPYSYRMRGSRIDHEQRAIRQGQIAINSMLRDWVKGQVMAVETGMLSFEAVFMPFMLTSNGMTLADRVAETGLLPAPSQ